MLTHTVMYRLTDPTDAVEATARIRQMRGAIPALKSLRTGTNACAGDAAYDVVLITEHDSEAGLQEYVAHPVHAELLTWLRPRISERASVDSTDLG